MENIIVFLPSVIFFVIGLFDSFSKEPVSFWTWKRPPERDNVCNIKAYNVGHGIAWILLGCLFAFSFLFDFNNVFIVILIDVLGVLGLIVVHILLVKAYVIDPSKATGKAGKMSKSQKILMFVITGIAIVFAGVNMFYGDVKINVENTEIQLNAYMTPELIVNYDDIESVEMQKDIDLGLRTNGIGNAVISAGNFRNDEFDDYKLYAYTSCDDYIVLKTKDGFVVCNEKTSEDTMQLYQEIMDKME